MYEELVKRLRCQRFGNCPNCPMWYTEEVEPNLWRERCAAIDAADAIEKLVRKEKFHAFLWNTIQPNEMEAYLSMYNAGDEKEEN